MKNLEIALIFILLAVTACTQSGADVSISRENSGMKLIVDGEPFIINGMNWDYYPIGTNYSYNLWEKQDEFIKTALESEMSLLKEIGVNAVRIYTGIPAKWISYIYEEYGIYTMLNHSFGRYGLTLDDKWVDNTDYADPRVKETLISEVTELAMKYRNTDGLLLYLLGNENNYGLFWEGAETEDIPGEDVGTDEKATAMYRLFNEAVLAIKRIDNSRPVAICNGDLAYLEIIKNECPDIDILGTNIYRGVSFGDAFQRVREFLDKPVMFTEFGADAYNVILNKEDQESQAYYILGNWKEIYANAAGMGKAGNSLGGFTFQFSDGWWKYGQDKNLGVHDTNASWANGGYDRDYQQGSNNMNEEWFGICAKDETDPDGHYLLLPRAAYYVLKEVHKYDPYGYGKTLEELEDHFSRIQLDEIINRVNDNVSNDQGQEL